MKAFQVEILVAGQKLTESVPTSAGATTFAWDGNDAYGRPLNGPFSVTTRIGYTYDIVATAGDRGPELMGTVLRHSAEREWLADADHPVSGDDDADHASGPARTGTRRLEP